MEVVSSIFRKYSSQNAKVSAPGVSRFSQVDVGDCGRVRTMQRTAGRVQRAGRAKVAGVGRGS
jgi:hypothetical protein